MMRKILFLIIFCLCCSSCATVPAVQSRVRRLAAQGDFSYATQVLNRLPLGSYGKNQRLLEAMDRGMIFHYAGDYQKSIEAFEDAKRIYNELYTKSISKIAASWLWNDSTLPYPGEDFERAMINVFEALDFIALGKYDGALVEARNANSFLTTVNDRYPPGQKNRYVDDAFVRLLMGTLYQSLGSNQEMNDAFISYQKAFRLYHKGYFSLPVPGFLRENLLLAAQWMGNPEFGTYRKKFSDLNIKQLDARQNDAEVYIICYQQQIVTKVSSTIILPGMNGLLTRISFPRYRHHWEIKHIPVAQARSQAFTSPKIPLDKVQDLDAIAVQNLASRRARILAKAIARPITKQLLVSALQNKVREKEGNTAGALFNYAGNLYLLYSEQADLRGWETLPAEIFMGEIFLPAGTYDLFLDGKTIAHFSLAAKERKFIMHWSPN